MNLTSSEVTILVSIIGMLGLLVGYIFTYLAKRSDTSTARAAALATQEATFQTNLWNVNKDLMAQLALKDQTIKALEAAVREKDTRIEDLTDEVDTLKKERAEQAAEMSRMSARIAALEKQVAELKERIVELVGPPKSSSRRISSAGERG